MTSEIHAALFYIFLARPFSTKAGKVRMIARRYRRLSEHLLERKSVAQTATTMTARQEPCLSERSNGGVSEGCGDWSVRITKATCDGPVFISFNFMTNPDCPFTNYCESVQQFFDMFLDGRSYYLSFLFRRKTC